jgi:hypothetical protein
VDSKRLKLSIRVAGNTIIPCLQVIAAKGYQISHYHSGTDADMAFWDAKKDGRAFSADSAESLLGLIAMWEHRGDDWHIKSGEEALLDRFWGEDGHAPDAITR